MLMLSLGGQSEFDVITRLTPRLLGHAGLIRGYLAERIFQPVLLVVAGDYPIDAEIAGACGADPWLPR